ncbi:MAG: tail fiber protein [Bacteroidia bacterium]|nr:tail fiber protein [Bacteroidia bacterium]NNL81687.1 phage tail protein [Flavobacteriaceae bacterium]
MNPFLGQITLFGFNFNPQGWATCDGQLLAINQFQALFSLLGTIYGGDGRTTFALPDLRGRSAIHFGNGPGLSNYPIGQRSGNETTTLSVANLPAHSHNRGISTAAGEEDSPLNNFVAMHAGAFNEDATNQVASSNTGSGVAFSNQDPYLVVNFCIALQGVYPSRS